MNRLLYNTIRTKAVRLINKAVKATRSTGPRPFHTLFINIIIKVRATSGLPFGLTDTMGAVDSGAISPLLRTSGSACCPWAQVSHHVEGPTRSNER